MFEAPEQGLVSVRCGGISRREVDPVLANRNPNLTDRVSQESAEQQGRKAWNSEQGKCTREYRNIGWRSTMSL
jgi:hypothetical protein